MRTPAPYAVLAAALLGCDDRATEARILVADPGLGQVLAFDQDGSPEGTWFDAAGLPAELQARGLRPSALREHDGEIWIAHDGDPAVFAADDHGWLRSILDNSQSPVRVEEPCAFTSDGDGSWLLANDSRTAARLDAHGQVVGQLADEVADPHGIAVLDGRIYVVSSFRTRESGTLRVWDVNGESGRSLPAPLVDPAAVLAVDGELWVADWGGDRVVRLDGEGRELGTLLATRRPVALALDPDDRLLVLGDEGLLRVDFRRSPGGAGEFRGSVERLTDPSPFGNPRNLLVTAR